MCSVDTLFLDEIYCYTCHETLMNVTGTNNFTISNIYINSDSSVIVDARHINISILSADSSNIDINLYLFDSLIIDEFHYSKL